MSEINCNNFYDYSEIMELKRFAINHAVNPTKREEILQNYLQCPSIENRNHLVEVNLLLVFDVAKKYYSRVSHLKLNDLVQSGCIGLIRAIQKYDPLLGSFSTYAYKWIKQAIEYEISYREKEIRHPVNVINSINKYNAMLYECIKNNKSMPSDEEICKILDISENMLSYIKKPWANPISMSMSLNNDSDDTIEDIIADSKDPYSEKLSEIQSESLITVAKEILSPLQYFVIYNHILSDNDMSLQQIGQYLNVTRERIRQIETKALDIMRPYVQNDCKLLEKKYRKIKEREGRRFSTLRKTPISPNDIIKYLYVKDELSPLENEIYKLKLFGKYDNVYYLNDLNITKDEFSKTMESLKMKIDKKLMNSDAFNEFKQQIVKIFRTKIYEIDLDGKVLDYSIIGKKFSGLNSGTILSCFKIADIKLTQKEKKLIVSYFSVNNKSNKDFENIFKACTLLQKLEDKISNLENKCLKLYKKEGKN